ncbi:hypothetical protein KKF91_01395 [Myxococcota bacterium]|nr:hypothetical protein [Myxococcota bacterium]MBU1429191.1 hypothetical protein [Myxococcota bacterium]MBU1899386.1 hypothetical protein [Myxococcota bacterium]
MSEKRRSPPNIARCSKNIAWLLALLCLTPAWAEAEGVLNVYLSEDVNGPLEPLVMFFDKRLTLVMPDDVRLAVPGSPDVLAAHIRDHVVVLTLIDSPYVRERRPTTNLSVFTRLGAPFTAQIQVGQRPEEARYDLVRVEGAPSRALKASDEALDVVTAWLKEGDAVLEARTQARFGAVLTPLLAARAHRQLLRRLARDGVEALIEPGVRVKDGFIYLDILGLYRVGDEAILRLGLTNHSQPAFQLARATLETNAGAVPARLEALEATVPDDGQARYAVISFDAKHLTGALTARLCEEGSQPRCVEAVLR